jgi:hypothetical protein
MFKKTLIGAVLAAGSLMALVPTAANAQYTVRVAPPPPMHEVVPGERPGFVWAPGHYEWRHGHYTWFRGHWMHEREGYVYREPRWIQRGEGNWALVGGTWERDHDHDRYAQNRRGDEEHRHWDREHRRWEHDHDGDGVPNRYDAHPNDPDRR